MGVCATNCYFLYREGGTKAVVVDPAENGAGIFKLLSEKDFTVEAILLTHGHFDHIGGAAELKKASGAKVYALAEEKKVCRTPELNLSAQMPPVVMADRRTDSGNCRDFISGHCNARAYCRRMLLLL